MSVLASIPEKDIRWVFLISVILKGINAILEILGGILLFFTGTITSLVRLLIEHELVEDSNDVLANLLQRYLPYITGHGQVFASVYLLSHGVIKIFLVVGLLCNKLWAYPAAIVTFFLFIIYQLYRFTHTHSLILLMITVFDILIIWLTWHEYRILKQRLIHNSSPV